MPSNYVLTTASSLACANSGTITPSSSAKLSVNHHRVLVQDDVQGQSITGCLVTTNTSQGLTQCSQVAAVTGGFAAKLQVGGQPVLLDSFQGLTNGTPPPLLVTAPFGTQPMAPASAGQTRLSAAGVPG